MQNTTIKLRVMGFVHDSRFELICLDTDIAVSADSIQEAKVKMQNATVSYFKSFSDEEIESGKFLRKAPIRYFVWWRVGNLIRVAARVVYFFSSIADYDKDSHTLRLA